MRCCFILHVYFLWREKNIVFHLLNELTKVYIETGETKWFISMSLLYSPYLPNKSFSRHKLWALLPNSHFSYFLPQGTQCQRAGSFLLVYIQIKNQVLSLTILISKIHRVGLDIAGDYPYFQPFPLPLGPPHLHRVSFCLQIIYLDTQKWHHRSSVKNSSFENQPQPSSECRDRNTRLEQIISPMQVNCFDLLDGQKITYATGCPQPVPLLENHNN